MIVPNETPIGQFPAAELHNIVKMLNFFSNAQWTYVPDSDDLQCHFKLGKGTLCIDTIATLSSAGARISLSWSEPRIYKVDFGMLSRTYFLQQNETLNFQYGVFDRVKLRDAIDKQVAEQVDESKGCCLM
jgi:hypothetical protein